MSNNKVFSNSATREQFYTRAQKKLDEAVTLVQWAQDTITELVYLDNSYNYIDVASMTRLNDIFERLEFVDRRLAAQAEFFRIDKEIAEQQEALERERRERGEQF